MDKERTGDNEKPPSSLDTRSGVVLTLGSMAQRFKSQWELLGDRSICPVRSSVSGRCRVVLKDI